MIDLMDEPIPLYSKKLFGHVGVLTLCRPLCFPREDEWRSEVKTKCLSCLWAAKMNFGVEFPQINRPIFLKGNSRDRFPHIFPTPTNSSTVRAARMLCEWRWRSILHSFPWGVVAWQPPIVWYLLFARGWGCLVHQLKQSSDTNPMS